MQDQFSNKQLSRLSPTGIDVFFFLKFSNFVTSKHCEIFKKIRISEIYNQKKKFKNFPNVFVIKTRLFVENRNIGRIEFIIHVSYLPN